MDPDGITFKLTEIKEKLSSNNALFIPMHSATNANLIDFLATKDKDVYVLKADKFELDGDSNILVNGEHHRISCFFNYNLHPDENMPVYIFGPASSPSLTSLKAIFDENDLLGRLRDPSCDHILADIKQVIKDMKRGDLDINGKSKVAQRFYKCTRANMEDLMLWKSTEEVDSSLGLVEDYVIRKCRSHLYALEEDKRNNQIFLEKSGEVSSEPIEEYQKIFEEMSEAKCPRQIGELVVELNMKLSGPETTAEDLLEGLSEAIISGRPKTLILDLLLLQRFREHRWLSKGKLAYCLTNLIAVINHLVRHEELEGEGLFTPVMTESAHYQEMGESSSMLPSAAPSSSFSDMASSVLNTIVFVPKAVGAAVADTFTSTRSRQISDPIYTPLQRTILEANSVDQLTMGQVKAMYEDYRRILSLLNK